MCCLWWIDPSFAAEDTAAEVVGEPEAEEEEEPGSSGIVGSYRLPPADENHRTITVDEAKVLPGTLGDPLRALLNLPSLSRAPLEAGWLLVRGGNARDSAFFLDGMDVPRLQHLGGLTTTIHPAWIQRVDFWPGTPPPRYGDVTAGTVELSTLESLRRPRVQAGANLALAGAFFTAPLGRRASVGGAIRRSYLDSVVGLVANAEAFPSFMDSQLALGFDQSRLFAMGTWDRLRGSYTNGDTLELRTRSLRVQGRLPTGRLRGRPTELLVWGGEDRETVENLVLPDEAQYRRAGGGLRWERPEGRGGGWDWTAGVDGKLEQHQVRSNGLARALWIGTPGVYGGLRFGRVSQLRLGLRAEAAWVQSQLPRWGLSPRLSGQVPVGAGLTWVADASFLEQLPPEDLLVFRPDAEVFGLEHVVSASSGLRWREEAFSVEVDLFGKWMPRVSLYEADGSLGQGQGRAAGVEFSANYQGEHLELSVACSYGRNQRREEPEEEWRAAHIEQPLATTLIATWHIRPSLHLSGRFRYADALPTPAGGMAVADLLTGQLETWGENDRLPAFSSIDLKLSTDISVRRFDLSLYLDAQNLSNHRIPEPVISSLSDPSSTWVVGLPILPIFGIEGSWR